MSKRSCNFFIIKNTLTFLKSGVLLHYMICDIRRFFLKILLLSRLYWLEISSLRWISEMTEIRTSVLYIYKVMSYHIRRCY
jgi:hypothetical protein